MGVSLTTTVAISGYLAGSRLLDEVLVQTLDITRSQSADAFGPFVTLLGLVYSVILGQIYSYYFDRQGVIQDAIFEESAQIKALQGCVEVVADRYAPVQRAAWLGVLQAHATELLATGFDGSVKNDERSMTPLVALVDALERATPGGNVAAAGPSSSALLRLASDSVGRVASARSRRVSAVTAKLPPVQTLTQRLIAFVLLLGFVLVDLGAPKLEALLFGTITGCFYLINSFLSDLAEPFGGSWSVDPARDEVESLARALKMTESA